MVTDMCLSLPEAPPEMHWRVVALDQEVVPQAVPMMVAEGVTSYPAAVYDVSEPGAVLYPPKFRPLIVTTVLPVGAAFQRKRYDTTGVSNEKVLTSVPT